MFEDKNRAKKRRYFIITVLLLLIVTGFGIGYYLNSGPDVNAEVNKNNGTPTTKLQIPDSLKNPTSKPPSDSPDIEEETWGQPSGQTSTYSESVVRETTKFIFRTHFTLCGHNFDNSVSPSLDELNMDRETLQGKFPDWSIGVYSPTEVIFTKEVSTICPRHFIIGIDNGCIAIFVYNEKGEKVLKEKTNITTNNLPPEDKKNLESGIIADNEDDLSQKLEGFSN